MLIQSSDSTHCKLLFLNSSNKTDCWHGVVSQSLDSDDKKQYEWIYSTTDSFFFVGITLKTVQVAGKFHPSILLTWLLLILKAASHWPTDLSCLLAF